MKNEIFGWNGKVLRVDLTREKIKHEDLDMETAHSLIGGRGLNIKVLFDEIKPGIDPLGPENVLVLGVGPLTGTQLVMSSRLEVSTLSPLSNILGDGSSGGFFPTFMKFSGYDQIVVKGRASKPKYLFVDDGKAELKDASDLWGKTTEETTDILVEDLGKDVKVACIGQAGENLVRFATTINDKYNSAARGSGAVWGSKKLKAIAVRGSKRPKIARPDEFLELVKKDRDFLLHDEFHQKTVAVYGTRWGFLHWWPKFRNARGYLEPRKVPKALRPEAMKKYDTKKLSCFNCFIGCSDLYEVPSGKYAIKGGKLEFETMACCGSNTGILDPEAIYHMDALADRYGMDTMELGAVIGLAKDLYENGVITKDDIGGLSLDWEDADGTIEIIHKIASREGFGGKLAEGAYNFAKLVDRGAMKYCFHVKGVVRDPARTPLIGLLYATSTRGADHLRGDIVSSDSPYNMRYLEKLEREGLVPKDVAGRAIVGQRAFLLGDILTRCKCGVYTWPGTIPLLAGYPMFDGVAKLLSAATGWDLSVEEFVKILDRIYTFERAFIVRQGITRKQDYYAYRAVGPMTAEVKKALKEHEKVLSSYYKKRGWDVKTGIPTRKTLESLGLKYMADELERHGPYPEWTGPPLK